MTVEQQTTEQQTTEQQATEQQTVYVVTLLHRRDYGDPDIYLFSNWFEAYQFAMSQIVELELEDEYKFDCEHNKINDYSGYLSWFVMSCNAAVYFETRQLI